MFCANIGLNVRFRCDAHSAVLTTMGPDGVAAVVGGTVRTVGTVAGTAVAAPLTILEQPSRTRANIDVSPTLVGTRNRSHWLHSCQLTARS